MRTLAIIAAILVLPAAVRAQDAEGKAVLAVVQKLFDGMRKGDTAAMRGLIASDARMLRLDRGGQVAASPVDGWLRGIGGKPAATIWNERTWAHEVRVDGNIAQAWMQYDFHIGDTFHHCGVDAFDFMKVGTEWKIVTIMDTSRTTGCTPPPGGDAK